MLQSGVKLINIMLGQTLQAALLFTVAQSLLICASGLSLEKPVDDGSGKVNLALTFKVNDEPVLQRLFENLDRAMTVGDLKAALSSTKLWTPSSEVAADDADSSELRVAIVADATDEEVDDDDVTLSTLLEQQQQQQRNENSTEDGAPQDQVDDKGGEFFPLFKQGFLQGLQANRQPGEKNAVKLTSLINSAASPFSKDFWQSAFSTFNFFKLADTLLKGGSRPFKPLFCFCPLVKAPVCGVDGVTYGNECLLKCKQVKLKHVGRCRSEGDSESNRPEQPGTSDKECACPLIEQPVCGTDGKTYANRCVLDCLGKTFAYDGKCSEEQPPEVQPGCSCPDTVEPVCGVDNKTYKNSCLLHFASVPLKHIGACTEEELLQVCGCTDEVRPVCGADGKSYMNKCLLECHGVQMKHDGPCHLVEDNCGCSLEFKPVCGIDGETYVNECTLVCKGTPLAHKGHCAGWPSSEKPVACPSDDDPVCGTDGITYLNSCWASSKNVQVAHKGKCEGDKDKVCTCPNTDAPVCGVDGVTYKNKCLLDCANVRLAAVGKCADRCKCPKKYDPVCGVNGVTYKNACYLRCNNVRLAHKGACRRATQETQAAARALSSVTREALQVDRMCGCLPTFEPVCGKDSKTYNNLCEMQCKDAQFAHDGECIFDEEPCPCTKEWDPVCATSGKTYPNICLMHCDGAVLKHKGRCTEKESKTAAAIKEDMCTCPKVQQFVCGADGKTYGNLCALKCSGTRLFHYGKCDFKMPTSVSRALSELDPCVCPDVLEPVCGVDGKTYDNECELECVFVELKHYGACETEEEPKCACPSTVEPVCGRDGETYQNECLMNCADTALLHAGPCSNNTKQPESVFTTPRSCGCPTVVDPVCGADGKTYANACLAKCHRVAVKHKGKCQGQSGPGQSPPTERICPCPRVRDPVCGADGKTYNNRCLLKCQGVEFVHYGKCVAGGQCGKYSDPVCGVNDKTYTNDCLRHKDGVLLKFRRPCHETDENYVCYCPKIKDPVCGRNGKTYRNECEMSCRGVELDHKGKCECPCPRILDPVCGSDGKTYNNKCLMECEGGVRLRYYGKCAPANTCPETVNPVCGTNGKTYANDCLRYRAGAKLLERSACPKVDTTDVVVTLPNCFCPTQTDLVCGKDGKTYINKCVLKCARVPPAYKGKCKKDPTPEPPKPPSDCQCPRILDPVCASDGKTYNNKCLMECEGQAKLLYFGRCIDGGVTTNACPDTVSPVCATNGKTYANDCLRYRDGATLLERDFCRQPVDPAEVVTMVQNCPCPTQSHPVCGKDGRTYFNECVMKYAQVQLAHRGHCRKDPVPVPPRPPRVCPCPRILDPVCASDGNTYNNKCLMECDGHTLLYYGRCGAGGVCPTACPDVTEPVCSTSGKTYQNDCFRYLDGAVLKERNACPGSTAVIVPPVFCECPRLVDVVCGRDHRVYINQCEMHCRQVSINHTGKCVRPYNENFHASNPYALCTTEYLPVCGVDGVTYGNRCLLEAQNIALSSDGPCYQSDIAVGTSSDQQICRCPRLYRPVCGADDNTYPNECVRECYNVELKHEGQCEL